MDASPVEWQSLTPRTGIPTASPARYVPPGTSGGRALTLGEQLDLDKADSGKREHDAHRKGFGEGEAAGRAQAMAQLDAAIGRLARTVEELSGMRERLRHEAEGDVVALALAIARRVIHRELIIEPEALLGLTKAALEKLDAREIHRVRTHASHVAMLQRKIEEIGAPRRIEVVADPGLEPGAAIFETGHGSLDASVETQLAEIERGFADLIRKAP
jgi:flagellar assembly protein FliH